MDVSCDSFQLIQAAPPLVPGNDRMLWDYLDNIPPVAINQRYTPSGGIQFTSAYKAVMRAMLPASTIDFVRDIGTETLHDFIAYLKQLRPTPRPNQRDLAAQLQRAPSGSFSVSSQNTSSDVRNSWSAGGHSALFGLLNSNDGDSSISQQFAQSTFTIQASFRHVLRFQEWTAYLRQVRPAPTEGQQAELFFDWAMRNAPDVASVSASDLNQVALRDAALAALLPYTGAAAKTVDYSGGIADLLVAVSRCGGVTITRWYDSALPGTVFGDHASPLWPAAGGPSWTNLFGSSGRMRHAIASLLVLDDLTIEVSSDATLSLVEQWQLMAHRSAGLWPCYLPDGSRTTTTVTFADASTPRVRTRVPSGTPVVIAAHMWVIGRFLGHATA